MRVVLDFGGTVVDRIDESRYSRRLEGDGLPQAGYVAYKAYSLGILGSEEEYIEVLSRLSGASREDCRAYLRERRLAVELPEERREVLEDLAARHSLVLFTDQVKEWIMETLDRLGISELFDDVIVSSELGNEKPHPKGYVRAMDEHEDAVMVSDELNDDLLMADYFGMTTVWVENDREEVVVEPDYRVDDLVELPDVVREVEPG